MSNYNTQLQSNNADLQMILQALQNKAAGGSGGDGYDEADSLITMTMSEYTNSRISSIGRGAFAYANSLTSANFPACTSVSAYAFYNCTSLTSISLPVCTSIGAYTFSSCSSLTSVNFPACTSVGIGAFRGCSNLTSISFPTCTSVGAYAFNGCTSLITANFPACTSIDTYAFQHCTSLTSIKLPMCTSISNYVFSSCTSLTSVSLPVCTSIGNYVFYNCPSLTSISLPACTNIGSYAFQYCYNLSQFYLTGSSLCKLSHSNAFSSTPYKGYKTSFSGTPYIYVPQSLLTSYKTATNWAYFSSYFSAVESAGGNLISFTANGTEFQAESGMTWSEWVESEYNTDGYYISGNNVATNDNRELLLDEGGSGLSGCFANDEIISNGIYSAGFPLD